MSEWNHMEDFTDEELRRIVYLQGAEYEPVILEEYREELMKRYPDGIWESDDTRLLDVLNRLNADELPEFMDRFFPGMYENRQEWLDLLDQLKSMQPAEDPHVMLDLIPGHNALSGAGYDWKVVGMDETATPLFTDAWKAEREAILKAAEAAGEEETDPGWFDLTYCPWAEWLAYRVRKKHLQYLGLSGYALICLNAMTAAGMDEETILREFELVTQTMDELSDGELDEGESDEA